MKINVAFAARGAVMILALTAGLLILGGGLDYWQAWVFGGVNLLLIIALASAAADEVGLIRDRMKAAQGTKRWDLVIMALFFPAALTVPVISAIDGGRWNGALPPGLYVAAYPIYAAGAVLHLWAILVNTFYTSTVAVRVPEGHRVETRGPYRLVRHPGYLGIIAMEGAMAVALGSLWGLVPAGFVAGLLILRCALEDTTLLRELPGYAEYARRVRFRILPGIW